MMEKPSDKIWSTADAHLGGALMIIASASKNGKPSAEMMDAIGSAVKSARDVLFTSDPLTRRIEFLFLAVRESTTVTETLGTDGKTYTTVKVRDRDLYNYAMTGIHKLEKSL